VRRCRSVAEDGTRPAGKHGRHPPALTREQTVTDSVNAPMNDVQAAAFESQRDCATLNAKVDQLCA